MDKHKKGKGKKVQLKQRREKSFSAAFVFPLPLFSVVQTFFVHFLSHRSAFKHCRQFKSDFFMQSVGEEIIVSTSRRTDSDEAKLLFNLLLITIFLALPNLSSRPLHHVLSRNYSRIFFGTLASSTEFAFSL
jgi:hypothetical protein